MNYVRSMNKGLNRLRTLPLSLRLIREIHAELLKGVRGGHRDLGEFRRVQNWIGPDEAPIAEATFVPPPPPEVKAAMGDLERFLHGESPMPLLIRTALVHAQFETIHPFLDGNGRVGRLLITFMLCARGVLRRPTLYLSHYFKRHRHEYYDRLQAVRDAGDFEDWTRFFLEGVRDVSREGTDTARRIMRLREAHRALIADKVPTSPVALTLLDRLFEQPVVTVRHVQKWIRRTYPVANQLVAELAKLDLLRQISEGRRNRVFEYAPYVEIFGELRP